MNSSKALTLLGFAARARKIMAGTVACEQAVLHGQAHLILLDASTAKNTRAHFIALCARAHVPLWACDEDTDAMGRAGQYGCKVLAITDREFARKIQAEIVR